MGLIQLGRLERTAENMLKDSPAYLDYQLRKYSPVTKTKNYLMEQLVLSHFSIYVEDGEVSPMFSLLKSPQISTGWGRPLLSGVFSVLFDINGEGVATLVKHERWWKFV